MGRGGEAAPDKVPVVSDSSDDGSSAAPFDGAKRWIVDGHAYDLRPFLDLHPGGPDFLLWSANRDVSIAAPAPRGRLSVTETNFPSSPNYSRGRGRATQVHTYHRNPEKTVLPRLRKYRVDDKPEAGVKRYLGVPTFLLGPDFDAVNDVPTSPHSARERLERLVLVKI